MKTQKIPALEPKKVDLVQKFQAHSELEEFIVKAIKQINDSYVTNGYTIPNQDGEKNRIVFHSKPGDRIGEGHITYEVSYKGIGGEIVERSCGVRIGEHFIFEISSKNPIDPGYEELCASYSEAIIQSLAEQGLLAHAEQKIMEKREKGKIVGNIVEREIIKIPLQIKQDEVAIVYGGWHARKGDARSFQKAFIEGLETVLKTTCNALILANVRTYNASRHSAYIPKVKV